MGSFNIGCQFTGSINCGEDAALIILLPNEYKNKNGVVKIYPTSNILKDGLSCSLYYPIGVIYGTYDDYGRMRNLNNDGTAKALADWVGISVEKLLEILTDYKDEGDIYGSSNTSYSAINEKILEYLADYRSEFDEDFLHICEFKTNDNIWYTHDENKDYAITWLAKNRVNKSVIDILPKNTKNEIKRLKKSKDMSWIMFIVKTINDDKYHSEFLSIGRNLNDFCNLWQKLTNYFLGYGTKKQKKLRVLYNLSGMWINRKAWDAYTKSFDCHVTKNSKSVSEIMNIFLNDLREKIARRKEYENKDCDRFLINALLSSKGFNPFDNNNILIDWSPLKEIYANYYEDEPLIFKDKQIQDDLIRLKFLKYNLNSVSRLFMPTFNGPQFGDLEAELEFARINHKILEERYNKLFINQIEHYEIPEDLCHEELSGKIKIKQIIDDFMVIKDECDFIGAIKIDDKINNLTGKNIKECDAEKLGLDYSGDRFGVFLR